MWITVAAVRTGGGVWADFMEKLLVCPYRPPAFSGCGLIFRGQVGIKDICHCTSGIILRMGGENGSVNFQAIKAGLAKVIANHSLFRCRG